MSDTNILFSSQYESSKPLQNADQCISSKRYDSTKNINTGKQMLTTRKKHKNNFNVRWKAQVIVVCTYVLVKVTHHANLLNSHVFSPQSITTSL